MRIDTELEEIASESREPDKMYRQVPNWWLGVATLIVVFSVSLATVGIVLASVAYDQSKNIKHNHSVTVQETSPLSDNFPVLQSNPAVQNERQSSYPGTPGYSGYLEGHPQRDLLFDVVVHGLDGDIFWNLVQNGVDDAARDMRVHVKYHNPEGGNQNTVFTEMRKNILHAKFSLSDGLAVSIPDDLLLNAIRAASADIPVMSLNAGDDYFLDKRNNLNLFTHVGQPERLAGKRAGAAMKAAGVQKAVCLLQDPSTFYRTRCEGFEEGFGGPVVRIETVSLKEVPTRLRTVIEGDPEINGLMVLSLSAFVPVHKVLKELSLFCSGDKTPLNSKCIELGTFDIDPTVLHAVSVGEAGFGMDQQQYLQGYLSIVFLTLNVLYELEAGAGNVVLSGPRLIDSRTVAAQLLERDHENGLTIGGKQKKDIHIRVITHGKPSDAFWDRVKSGVKCAARDIKVQIDYRHPPEEAGSTAKVVERMGDAVTDAINEKVDGLVVSLVSDAESLTRPVQQALDAGIPVISINAGLKVSEELKIAAHIGQQEDVAGRGVGARLSDMGAKKVLCVMHEVNNVALDRRCEGMAEILEVVKINESDGVPFDTGVRRGEVIESGVRKALEENPTIDAVVALGPVGAIPTRKALKKLGKLCSSQTSSCTKFATFDLSVEILQYIKDFEMEFAVDQQQFLQGYLPVMFLALEALWGDSPIEIIDTGPGFVDVNNAAKVEALAAQDIR